MFRIHSRAAAAAALAIPVFPAILACTTIHAAESVSVLPAIAVSPALSGGLDSVTSTGSTLRLTGLQTPASVSVITRQQLEQFGDANLADTITRSVGLSHIGHPGNGGAALSARGFTGSSSVMQLYDGKRQYGGIGITFPFDPWSVERIEVLRGPASVIYGEGAIGGVVNVIPKKP